MDRLQFQRNLGTGHLSANESVQMNAKNSEQWNVNDSARFQLNLGTFQLDAENSLGYVATVQVESHSSWESQGSSVELQSPSESQSAGFWRGDGFGNEDGMGDPCSLSCEALGTPGSDQGRLDAKTWADPFSDSESPKPVFIGMIQGSPDMEGLEGSERALLLPGQWAVVSPAPSELATPEVQTGRAIVDLFANFEQAKMIVFPALEQLFSHERSNEQVLQGLVGQFESLAEYVQKAQLERLWEAWSQAQQSLQAQQQQGRAFGEAATVFMRELGQVKQYMQEQANDGTQRQSQVSEQIVKLAQHDAQMHKSLGEIRMQMTTLNERFHVLKQMDMEGKLATVSRELEEVRAQLKSAVLMQQQQQQHLHAEQSSVQASVEQQRVQGEQQRVQGEQLRLLAEQQQLVSAQQQKIGRMEIAMNAQTHEIGQFRELLKGLLQRVEFAEGHQQSMASGVQGAVNALRQRVESDKAEVNCQVAEAAAVMTEQEIRQKQQVQHMNQLIEQMQNLKTTLGEVERGVAPPAEESPIVAWTSDLRRLEQNRPKPVQTKLEEESPRASVSSSVRVCRLQPVRHRAGQAWNQPGNYWSSFPEMAMPSAPASVQGSVAGNPAVQIHAVGQAAPQMNMAAMHPVLASIWQKMKKPNFSGCPEDVPQFVREWSEVEAVIRSSSIYPVNDLAILIELRGCLDAASAETLKAHMELNPQLTYHQFWEDFRRQWGVDTQKQNRADWRAVKLAKSGADSSEVTLADWRLFQARFEITCNRVADRTDAEAYQLIFCQLTRRMQSELTKEQGKRRDSRPWVSITVPKGQRVSEVLEEIEEYRQAALPPHEVTCNGCIIKCHNEEEREELLRLNGFGIEGLPLDISRHEYEMKASEIFSFFLKRLRTEHECSTTRKSFGIEDTSERNPAKVATKVKIVAVDSQSAMSSTSPGTSAPSHQQQASRGKGKGGKGGVADRMAGRGKGGAPPRQHDNSSPAPAGASKQESAAVRPDRKQPYQYERGVCNACKEKGLDALHDWRLCQLQIPAEIKEQVMAAMAKDMKERQEKKDARFNTPQPSK